MPVYEHQKRIIADAGIKGNAVDSIETIKQVTGKRKTADLTEQTEDYREYHLEKTGNPHVLKVQEYKILSREGGTETLSISGDAFVIHHEHQMLRIGKGCFVKYIQQEYNPITNLTENAYD